MAYGLPANPYGQVISRLHQLLNNFFHVYPLGDRGKAILMCDDWAHLKNLISEAFASQGIFIAQYLALRPNPAAEFFGWSPVSNVLAEYGRILEDFKDRIRSMPSLELVSFRGF